MPDLLVTCEHASNAVPDELSALSKNRTRLLASHRAYDPGALTIAEAIARNFSATVIAGACTRLAVDCNRSDRNPRRFSEFSRTLDEQQKQLLEARYHRPFRRNVRHRIDRMLSAGNSIIHLSVHSFTPVLNGVERRTDIGLLYDPSRERERAFAALLKRELLSTAPALGVRFNYPYRGVSDGTATWLRGITPPQRYIGIEIECNQKLLRKETSLARTAGIVARAVLEAVGAWK